MANHVGGTDLTWSLTWAQTLTQFAPLLLFHALYLCRTYSKMLNLVQTLVEVKDLKCVTAA